VTQRLANSATKAAQSPHNTGRCAHLDEGAGQEEAVREADLDAAQQRADAGAVRGQVGQVRHDERRARHRGLEHRDEGVAVERLDDLGLLFFWF
jgi:hypothetical protein